MITPNDINLGIEFYLVSLGMEINPVNLGMQFYEGYYPYYIPYPYEWLFGDGTEMLFGDMTTMITYL